jgi:DNA-binding NtrC family response regulator
MAGGPSATPRGDRSSVLVVDDEPAVRRSVEAVLCEDFDVHVAAGAPEAMQIVRARRLEVVITDHHMPAGSGAELLRRIQSYAPEIVCILMTGHAELPEVVAARSEKLAFHILIKPVNPEQLLVWTRTASQSARLRTAVQGLKRRLQVGRS